MEVRIVLCRELQKLCKIRTDDFGRKGQRHIDSRSDAPGHPDFSVDDDPIRAGLGAELAKRLEPQPMASRAQ